MSLKYFERIIQNIEFDFIPLFSSKDNSILGYKVIKDFSKLGFDDKEYMYQLAYDLGIFEDFTLQLFKKSCIQSVEKKISDKFLFYTLRINFVRDIKNFFYSINNIINEKKIDKEKIIFDIKGIDDWKEFYKNYSYLFDFNLILKEDINTKLSINNIINSRAIFIEPRSIETLNFIRSSASLDIPFIFNLKREKEPLSPCIKTLKIDYYYNY